MENFEEHIAHCFVLIEEKLSRGTRDTWDTYDFMVLSESIKEVTGTLLSVSTLKRLTGKVNYSSKPNSTTLNALAGYVGFEDWRSFLNSANMIEAKEDTKPKENFLGKYRVAFSLLILALLFSIYLFFNLNDTTYEPDDFAFSVKSVTIGLPNSVVFEYDATAADKKAKIEIQQDWDERKRVSVSKEDSVSTSIYFWPGYFKSKLVIDNTIVKEKDILIPSPNWLATIETDSLPIYLDNQDFQNSEGLAIKPEVLKKYGVDPRASKTIVGLYQVRDFGELYTNDFEMTTSLRNDFKSGNSLCQGVQVMILHEEGPIGIILSNKGCISDISIYAFDVQIDGKKTDLSDFGVDFTDYVKLKCVSKNQKLDIFLDNKLVFSFDVPEKAKRIVGICFFFEGAGSVKNVEFKKNHEVVYSSGF